MNSKYYFINNQKHLLDERHLQLYSHMKIKSILPK